MVATIDTGATHRDLVGSAQQSAQELSRMRGVPSLDVVVIPGYELTRTLSSGAQGVVYQATQTATRRKVAIKVMKDGPFASPMARARFDREVVVLGQLKHPNIVTIHGTGVAAGHPYLVMDYISGQALDEYVASVSPPVRELLGLFAKICDAVNAAHLRGVIHRDLKPSNIRVDEFGEPHVLDFGLARSTPDGFDALTVTTTGQIVGSLPWASPEQAEGVPGKLDLRTDVYSIGVVLYQALTGRFPYDITGNLRDVLVRIVSREPVRPRTLRTEIDDDVETIVLKCLEKDPGRRYQTAGGVARDIRLYLAGEPIDAKRDSTLYVLGKRLRRHRGAVAVGTGFLLTILAGLITSAAGWNRAASERDSAEEARAQAQAVTAFLVETLGTANPYAGRGSNATIGEVLQAAEERIEVSFRDQPLLQAAVLESLAGTYDALGRTEAANDCAQRSLELRRRELPPDHPDIALSLCFCAQTATKLARHAEAEKWARESLRLRRQHPSIRPDAVIDSLLALGVALTSQARFAEAEPVLREAARQTEESLGAHHRLSIVARTRLAGCLLEQMRPDEAKPLLEEALAHARESLPADHPDIAQILASLGEVRYLEGDHASAEAAQAEALAIRRRNFGEEHVTIANSLSNLALLCVDDERFDDAERMYRQSLELRRRLYGSKRLEVTYALIGLARVNLITERPAEAQALLREALEIFDQNEARNWRRAYAQCLLGVALGVQGQVDEAEPLLIDGVAGVRAVRGDRDRFTREVLGYALEFYEAAGRPDDALAFADLLKQE